MDSFALNAMADVIHYATDHGHSLFIGSVQPIPAWVLAFCDRDNALAVHSIEPDQLQTGV